VEAVHADGHDEHGAPIAIDAAKQAKGGVKTGTAIKSGVDAVREWQKTGVKPQAAATPGHVVDMIMDRVDGAIDKGKARKPAIDKSRIYGIYGVGGANGAVSIGVNRG